MDTQDKKPETLMEAMRYFADSEVTHQFVADMRWPNGVQCVFCESDQVGYIKSRKRYQCKACRKQFSVRHDSIFEDSAISLDKWVCAIWMLVNCKNGVSSYEVHREIGVTQKTAWFMLQRIRLAMQTESFDKKLSGYVEVDETYIGGKARNMHPGKRKARGGGPIGKIAVMGLLQRHGEVRTHVIPSARKTELVPRVIENVEEGSYVYTDELKSYTPLENHFIHGVINHAECYVKNNIHTNGMENYWSLLKRGLRGTYVSVEPFHLFRYLDEQAFRFNNRKATNRERFEGVVRKIAGKRLTYGKLTGEAAQP